MKRGLPFNIKKRDSMGRKLYPHRRHDIEFGDELCYNDRCDDVIAYLREFNLYSMESVNDCQLSEHEISEDDLKNAIDHLDDMEGTGLADMRNLLVSLYERCSAKDGTIHFSVL